MTRINRFAGSFLFRLAVGYVLVAVIFAAAWVWSLYGPLTEAMLRQQQRNLTAVAQSAALLAAETDSTPQELANRLVTRTDLRLTIVGSDGVVLADSEYAPSEMENHGQRPEIRAALAGQVGVDRRMSRTAGIEEIYVAVPSSLDGRKIALRVSQPLSEIEDAASRSRRFGLGLLAVALLIAAGVAFYAARAATGPVRQLSDIAERMAAGNLNVDVPAVPADLTPLADALATLRAQMRSRLDALETERRTLRAALDGLGDAVLLVDGDTIVLANKETARLFRAPARGWVGTRIDESGLPATLLQAVCSRLDSLDPSVVELPADPTGRTWRVFVAPLSGADDGTSRTIVVISDVTERARVDRVRRDFVANASHELKTPVAGIRLLAESAETAAADGDAEQALVFTRQIEAETERLQRLVSDLLDLSRLEAAPAPDALADVRVAVDRAVVSHRAAAARKELELTADLDSVRGHDVFVRADPTDLAIALDNLLDNAIAYTDSGGVNVGVRIVDDHVAIRVSDTGCGIPVEHQPRVFERFYRVDRGRSRDAGGTGLGLALVRHVVERSGGTVTLESALGEGSTFTLMLPRAT